MGRRLDLIVRNLAQAAHHTEQPALDVALSYRDQRAERQALAHTSGRRDSQTRDAAILDLPHRIAPRRQTGGERVILDHRLALGARRARDRKNLDLLGARFGRSVLRLGADIDSDARESDAQPRLNSHRESRLAQSISMGLKLPVLSW